MVRHFPRFQFRRGALAIGLCLALGACQNPWLEDAPSLETVLSRGWLIGDKQAVAVPRTAPALYCYETIGVGDCHHQPLEDGGNRLVGFEGPSPMVNPEPAKP